MRVSAVVQVSLVLAATVVSAWAALRVPAVQRVGPEARGGALPDAGPETTRVESVAQATAETVPAAPPVSSQTNALPVPVSSERALLPPDLVQSDPELGLPGGGAAYCAPVSASNSLMRLAAQGFERLAPDGATPRSQQVALVRALATTKYMGTSPADGTGPTGMLRGLSRWVEHVGYRAARLEYQGWRDHPPSFSTGVTHPKLGWLAEALGARGAAWLHIGWYRRDRFEPGLRRRGGHWLTLVSVEEQRGEATITVRDPAPYAGDTPTLEHVALRELDRGMMVDGAVAFPAKGYYELASGLHLKRPDDVPVIDGAVILVLEAPE